MRSVHHVAKVAHAFDTAVAGGLTAPVAMPAERIVAKRRVLSASTAGRKNAARPLPRLPSHKAMPHQRAASRTKLYVLVGVAAGSVCLWSGCVMAANGIIDSCMV